MNIFEEKIKNGLNDCITVAGAGFLQNLRIGVAVSGGADSVSLLLALSEILKQSSSELNVITVNHHIRAEEETSGDAAFVVNLCNQLKENGYNIECKVVEFKQGLVFSVAEERKAGVEEAARFLRYKAFETFIQEKNLDCLCLAHNKNDQLETLVMRFLQGSSIEGSVGILSVRDKYFRPMLQVTRKEIEVYLKEKNQNWRTDKSNFDNTYLRNKIRNAIIPVFEKEFPGWEKAVLSGAKKNIDELNVINRIADSVPVSYDETNSMIIIDKAPLLLTDRAVQIKVLFRACNRVIDTGRIPLAFINDVLDSCSGASGSFTKQFGNIEIVIRNEKVFVKKHVKKQTDFCFFDIIEKNELFSINGRNYVVKDSGLYVENTFIGNISFPFCIRSFQPGDVVKAADGTEKKIVDIFSDWHVPEDFRGFIPIVQELGTENQEIRFILGNQYGFKDWILKVL